LGLVLTISLGIHELIGNLHQEHRFLHCKVEGLEQAGQVACDDDGGDASSCGVERELIGLVHNIQDLGPFLVLYHR
jgi:hypothetical protein